MNRFLIRVAYHLMEIIFIVSFCIQKYPAFNADPIQLHIYYLHRVVINHSKFKMKSKIRLDPKNS